MRGRSVRTVVTIALSLLMVVMLSGSAQSAVVIKNSGNAFRPAGVKIHKGAKVTWRIVSGFHTVTSTSPNWFKNTTLSAGQSTAKTFKRTGVYRYRCMFHSTFSNGVCSGMCGRIRVIA
jgi:plastocyanin